MACRTSAAYRNRGWRAVSASRRNSSSSPRNAGSASSSRSAAGQQAGLQQHLAVAGALRQVRDLGGQAQPVLRRARAPDRVVLGEQAAGQCHLVAAGAVHRRAGQHPGPGQVEPVPGEHPGHAGHDPQPQQGALAAGRRARLAPRPAAPPPRHGGTSRLPMACTPSAARASVWGSPPDRASPATRRYTWPAACPSPARRCASASSSSMSVTGGVPSPAAPSACSQCRTASS